MGEKSSGDSYQMTNTDRWEQTATRVLTFLCLLAASVYILFWVIIAGQSVLYPYGLQYEEGALLHQALQLARGQQIYNDLTTPPYMTANYPPVFIALWALLAGFAGAVFWPGRLIAALSSVGIGLAIYRIVKHFTADRWAAVLALGCFLWCRPMRYWTAFAVTDTLAIACALAGLAVIISAQPRRRWLAVPLFVLAFFTKQTMVAAPAAAYLYLWLEGERMLAGRFFVAHVMAIGIIFALM